MLKAKLSGPAIAALLVLIAPVAAHAQVKPTVTVVNPVSSPVNTRITNTVVPVEISNADPIPVQAASAATPLDRFFVQSGGLESVASIASSRVHTVIEPMQLTGLTLQVNARGTSESCQNILSITDSNGGVLGTLASVSVFAGRSASSSYIPLPNLPLAAGDRVTLLMINETGEFCEGHVNLFMTRN